MRTFKASQGFALLVLLPGLLAAQESVTCYGLRHTAVGGTIVRAENGYLTVRPPEGGGDFGVSVDLGQADSGVFGRLDSNSSLQESGTFMIGQVYGKLNGQTNQFICSLGVTTVDAYGRYNVSADFSGLGASAVTYLVYNNGRLVGAASNVVDPIAVLTGSETSPAANPFYRQPDGSIVGLVQLSWPQSIELPGWDYWALYEEGMDYLTGDRIIIRPEGVTAWAEYASRVDLTAGGGEDWIMVTDERLGVFGRMHKLLGNGLLQAQNGQLTVLPSEPGASGEEQGLAISLEQERQFGVELQPVELATNGATLMTSAIGSYNQWPGEFLGLGGICNQAGVLQAYADFSSIADAVQVGVYREGHLIGTVGTAVPRVRVNLTGNPRVIGLSAKAELGVVHPGFAIRLDRPTTFTLPDGGGLDGDQISFHIANRVSIESFSVFSLSWSNLPSLTVVAETGPNTVNVADFYAEVQAPVYLKRFYGETDGSAVDFVQSSVWTNTVNGPRVLVLDQYATNGQVTGAYGYKEDGLHFYGFESGTARLTSMAGARVLPEPASLGQTYYSAGSFAWQDTVSGQEYPVEVSITTRISRQEQLQLGIVPEKALRVVRVETEMTFGPSGASNAPTSRLSTNWLAEGVGVVRFQETELLAAGGSRARSGQLADTAIVQKRTRTHRVNVGANIYLKAELILGGAGQILDWRKDGVPLSTQASIVPLSNVRDGDAGRYDVVISVPGPEGSLASQSAEIANVQVVPFSDTPPFWVASLGATAGLRLGPTAADTAGNLYVAGEFQGALLIGTNSLSSAGGDDIFVAKFSPAGELVWARQAGGTDNDRAAGLGVDGTGNVYLGGSFRNSIRFGSNTLMAGSWSSRLYLTKLNADGQFLWAVQGGGSAFQFCTDLAVDTTGNAYLLGGFENGDVLLGDTTLTNENWSADLLFAKADPDGHFLWAKQITGEYWGGGASYMYGRALVLDGSGAIYFSCRFEGTVTLDQLSFTSYPYYSGGLVVKADPDGHYLWAWPAGCDAGGLAVDPSGNVYVTGNLDSLGRLGGGMIMSGSAYGISYIAKLTPQAQLIWARTTDLPQNYDAYPMVADTAGNLYQAGGFYDQVTLGGTTYFKRGSSTLVVKRDPNGQVLWRKQLTDFSGAGDNWPTKLARDNAGNVYLGGIYRGGLQVGETNAPQRDLGAYLVQITGATGPAIVQQPQSQTVTAGDTVTFSVTATGTAPLGYQWRKDGQNLDGATASSLTLANAQAGDSGLYSVLVNNAGGVVVSENASLTVVVPEAGAVVFQTPTLAVTETNAMLVVQVARSGSTTDVATVEVVSSGGTATEGADYLATAVSLQFGPGETLKSALLPILDDSEPEAAETIILSLCNPGPGTVVGPQDTLVVTLNDNDTAGSPYVLWQPRNQTVRVGSTVGFGVVVSGAEPLQYQWRKDGTELAGATNRVLTLSNVQPGDGGTYTVVIRNASGEVTSAGAVLSVYTVPDHYMVMFGLTNRPLGRTLIDTNGGYLVITPTNHYSADPDAMDQGGFGVSISLGEADSGLFGYLSTSGAFDDYGNYTMGTVYGRLNGQPNQMICSLEARTSDPNGRFDIRANFSPLGASQVTYEIYRGAQLVASVQHVDSESPVALLDYSEGSPRANPFWRLPDGSIAAVIDLSADRELEVPGADDYAHGDRIVIRPEGVNAQVDYASRVDVTAGGGESVIIITDEQLGVFNHRHKALGDVVLNAAGGALRVARLSDAHLTEEAGVSIGMENERQFSLKLQPQALAPETSLTASALGSSLQRAGGDFLGLAGVRNRNGSLQAFGDFTSLSEGLQLSVYRQDCLVGTITSPTLTPTISLSGSPQVTGFEASADGWPGAAWLSVLLDGTTTFGLPDGSSLEGDEIRFRSPNPRAINWLSAFNLTCTGAGGFVITSEGERQRISLVEYLPELTAPAFLKRFISSETGLATEFIRSGTRLTEGGNELRVISDTYPDTNVVSATYSLREEGVQFHGYAQAPLELGGDLGLALAPGEMTLGQSYLSQGSLVWREAGVEYPVEASALTTAAGFESFTVSTGSFAALRLETVMTFSGSASNLPAARYTTNWLVAGVGVIKFSEMEVYPGGGTRSRSGELTDYALLTTPLRTYEANVGANIILDAGLVGSAGAMIEEWQKDGNTVMLPQLEGTDRLHLLELQQADAGSYSVLVSLRHGDPRAATMVSAAGDVRVIPFSDSPPFWTAGLGVNGWMIEASRTAVDASGNVYVCGQFTGELYSGSTALLASQGSADIFLAKFGPLGQLLWVRQIGGSANDYARGLGVDSEGNAYLAGFTYGALTIGSYQISPGTFVTKLDADGYFRWAVSSTGSDRQDPASLAVDGAGNQYLFGGFGATLTLGTTTLTNETGQWNLFLAKLDSAGQILWAQAYTGQYVLAGQVLLDANSLYLAGSFRQSIQVGNVSLSSGRVWRNAFVVKGDLNGNMNWGQLLEGTLRNATLDAAGNVVLATASAEFAGSPNVGLSKVAPDGTVLWTRSSEHLAGYYIPLVADSQNNVYLGGSFHNEGRFGGTTFSQPGESSTILTKFTPDGQLLWNKQLTAAQGNWPAALGRDNSGNAYLAGAFQDNILFGDSRLTSPLHLNMYLVKITGATAPTITQQPQPITVNEGQAATFTVQATGTAPLIYQWRKDGRNLEGPTAATYTVAAAQWSDRGVYTVQVRNAGGFVISTGARLTVQVPDAGTVRFTQTDYALTETNVVVWVNVERTGNTSAVALVELKAVDGTATAGQDYMATVASLRFGPGQTLKSAAVPIWDDTLFEPTETVIMRLSNPGAGTAIGTPDTATISLADNDVPGMPVITKQPLSQSVGAGRMVSFAVVANGAPALTYQWRKNGVDIPGATQQAYRVEEAQFTDAGAYSVVVQNAVGAAISAEALLTVLPLLDIVVPPLAQTVPYGEPVTLSVVATTSVAVATQVFQRVSTGVEDWFNFPVSGSGILYIHYNFGTDPDHLVVYAIRGTEAWQNLGSVATNGAGILEVPFGHLAADQLAIMVNPDSEVGIGDGWSYRAEKVAAPLTYQWLKYGWPIQGAQASTFTIPFFNTSDAAEYSVAVSDASGTVYSPAARLTMTGPLLVIEPVACTNGATSCIRLSWKVQDYHLEMRESMEAEWYDVPNAYSGMIMPVSESQFFFRLRRTERPD